MSDRPPFEDSLKLSGHYFNKVDSISDINIGDVIARDINMDKPYVKPFFHTAVVIDKRGITMNDIDCANIPDIENNGMYSNLKKETLFEANFKLYNMYVLKKEYNTGSRTDIVNQANLLLREKYKIVYCIEGDSEYMRECKNLDLTLFDFHKYPSKSYPPTHGNCQSVAFWIATGKPISLDVNSVIFATNIAYTFCQLL